MARQVMSAGRLRQQVRIEKPAGGKDAFAQPTGGWTEVLTAWACVEPASARESWGGRLGVRPDVSEVVTVRFRQEIADAGAAIRLVVITQGGRVLQAVGVERDEQGVWLTIPCKSAGQKVTP